MTREFVAPVTSKGQVTIPAEIRARLHIDTPGRVVFILTDDGEIAVRALRFPTIQSLRGIAGKLDQPMDWDEMVQIGREDGIRLSDHQ